MQYRDIVWTSIYMRGQIDLMQIAFAANWSHVRSLWVGCGGINQHISKMYLVAPFGSVSVRTLKHWARCTHQSYTIREVNRIQLHSTRWWERTRSKINAVDTHVLHSLKCTYTLFSCGFLPIQSVYYCFFFAVSSVCLFFVRIRSFVQWDSEYVLCVYFIRKSQRDDVALVLPI